MASNYIVEPEIKVDLAAEETVALSPTQQELVDPLNSGFVWYTPPMASPTGNHETFGTGQQWTIAGHDMQVLTLTLPPNEQVVTEVGSFFYGSKDITMNVELTLCTNGSEGCNRICGGESCVKLLLLNDGPDIGYVGMTPNFPAKIIPIQFGKHINGNLIAQSGAYMSHLGDDVNVGCDLDCSITTCCCAGFGCLRQKITGSTNNIAFLAAGGTLVYKKLQPNEQITVDSRSVVAIEDSVQLGIISNGRLCTCCFGGEGCCSTTLTGPGKIFMQSMSFKKFQEAVQVTVIDDRGSSGGGGA